MQTFTIDLECHLKKHPNFKNKYKLLRVIGEGAFGKVHLVEDKEQTEYAVKVIGTKGDKELDDARLESRLFRDLQHPHIVNYKDAFEIPNGVVVVMEYCRNGDLQQRINTRTSRPPILDFFPETQVVEWATQACQALQYLHSKYILHRDLKPANMLLTSEDIIKLADFGSSKKLEDLDDVTATFCGTPLYQSPEVVLKKPYSHKADVWAAGCCFYEMMALNPAIDPIPVRLAKQWNVRPMPMFFSQELCEIIKSMLCIDVPERPSIGDILSRLISIQSTEDSPTPARGPRAATVCLYEPAAVQIDPPANELLRNPLLPPTPARRAVSVPVTPGRSSPEAVVNRIAQTLDVRRPEGPEVHEGVARTGAAREGQRPRTTWYSDLETALETNSNDGFWTISNSSIVDNLAALGVRFNDQGELVELSGGRFQFNSFSDDQTTNQMRYEEIGQQVTQYVYSLLETKLNMKRHFLPIDASDEPRSFVFVTDDYTTNDKKLLVLVHGPGVPRAGQWARRVIMNDSLAAGTQIPWIQRAVEKGYAVIVLNPNLNEVTGTPIRDNKDGIEHALYIWDKVISTEVKAKKITFAAHSDGAQIIVQLAVEREKEFANRVVGIALADSCLDFGSNARPSVISLFAKRARIWASSDKPLGTILTSHRNHIPKRSAGETRHEWTAGSCIPSAIKFLNKRS